MNKIDHGFAEEKQRISKCFQRLGLNSIAYDVTQEDRWDMLKTYADAGFGLALQKRNVKALDELIDSTLVRRLG